jgi:hypothetical protein
MVDDVAMMIDDDAMIDDDVDEVRGGIRDLGYC